MTKKKIKKKIKLRSALVCYETVFSLGFKVIKILQHLTLKKFQVS